MDVLKELCGHVDALKDACLNGDTVVLWERIKKLRTWTIKLIEQEPPQTRGGNVSKPALAARQRDFLYHLQHLCQTYNATFSYTTDDDGIHISMDGEEIFIGFLEDPAGSLRERFIKDLNA